nr:response regulator [Massilia oculi]
MGHTVLVAHSAREALTALPAFGPDVCLLDIGLPEMNGYELAAALRKKPGTAQAILIAVTGYAQEKDRALALAAGFHDLFAKPVDLDVLGAALVQIESRRAA